VSLNSSNLASRREIGDGWISGHNGILELLGAGPDHPQRPDFPRSRYLKGALLAVD
jgi:hypothetical protein